ncbi:MAG: protein kinase [Myxococcales bacterium]|nr:protein kinase [Myxococcales bacterium]
MTSIDARQLGPFRLERMVGQGGMGEVWLGVHEDGFPVAVKILSEKANSNELFRRAFNQEAEAMAQLSHVGIISIYDRGIVTREIGPMFEPGRLFLAMEVANGGAASDLLRPLPWAVLRRLMVDLLDALRHAHARGIVHRDLKPDNILFAHSPVGLIPKIADFGISHAWDKQAPTALEGDSDAEREAVVGSPSYMAPEQVRGLWRDYGPWTDLYSLGCIAYELATGKRPFVGKDKHEIAHARLRRKPAPANLSAGYPPSFSELLDLLLATDIHERIRFARDALKWFEDHSPDTTEIRIEDWLDLGDRERTAYVTQFTVSEDVKRTGLLPDRNQAKTNRALPERSGLRLFELRETPIVGRRDHQKRLSDALFDVIRSRKPRGIVLHGPAGSGKSRLTEWLALRAHEEGLALRLRASHMYIAGRSHGVSRMFAGFFRCIGLPPDRTLHRLYRELGALGLSGQDARALTQIIHDAETPEPPIFRFSSDDERLAIMVRILQGMAGRRAVLLTLDNIDREPQSIRLARYLLETFESLPLLLVATARTSNDARGHSPWQDSDDMEALTQHDRCDLIEVPNLDPSQHQSLLQTLLPVASEVAEVIVERTGGNPLFAIQLVRDLLRRGELEWSAGRLKPIHSELELPKTSQSLWLDRIELGLNAFPVAKRGLQWLGLELAAALGEQVNQSEWSALCAMSGVQVASGLLDELISLAVAARQDEGWRFSHGSIVETLRRRAEENGRWADHHRQCAQMIQTMYSPSPASWFRRGQHLLFGESYDEAFELFVQTARRWLETGRAAEAEDAIQRARQALECIHPGDADRRLPMLDALETRALVGLSSLLPCAELGQRMLEWSERNHDDLYTAEGHVAVGLGVLHENLSRSLVHFNTAVEIFRRLDAATSLSRALTIVSACVYRKGDVEGALAAASEAAEICQRALRQLDQEANRFLLEIRLADALALVSAARLQKGEVDTAAMICRQTIDIYRRLGNVTKLGRELNTLGDIERYRGNNEGARAIYTEAIETLDVARCIDSQITHLNIVLLDLLDCRFESALPILDKAIAGLRLSGRDFFTGVGLVLRLAVSSGLGDFTQWDETITETRRILIDRKHSERDAIWAATMAAEHADRAGYPERARQAFLLAADLAELQAENERALALRARADGTQHQAE